MFLVWSASLASSTPDQSFQSANRLFEQKNYRAAKDAYTTWISQYGTHSLRTLVLFNLGKCHEALGEWTLAIESYKKVMEVSHKSTPEFKDALYRQMIAYEKSGQWEQALVNLGALGGYSLTGYRLAELGLRRWFYERRGDGSSIDPKSLSRLMYFYSELEAMDRAGVVPEEAREILSRAAIVLARYEYGLLSNSNTWGSSQWMQRSNVQSRILIALAKKDDQLWGQGLNLLESLYKDEKPGVPKMETEKSSAAKMGLQMIQLYEAQSPQLFKLATESEKSRIKNLNLRVLVWKGILQSWQAQVQNTP